MLCSLQHNLTSLCYSREMTANGPIRFHCVLDTRSLGHPYHSPRAQPGMVLNKMFANIHMHVIIHTHTLVITVDEPVARHKFIPRTLFLYTTASLRFESLLVSPKQEQRKNHQPRHYHILQYMLYTLHCSQGKIFTSSCYTLELSTTASKTQVRLEWIPPATSPNPTESNNGIKTSITISWSIYNNPQCIHFIHV